MRTAHIHPRWTRVSVALGLLLFVLLPLGYFAALAPYGLNLDDEGTVLYQISRAYSKQGLY